MTDGIQLQLYELLIPWYQCKADRNRVKALKLQWKETGLKLSAALAEHQPAIDFKQRLEDEVEKAGKGIRTAENEIKKLETEVKKLKRQDDEHVRSPLSHRLIYLVIYISHIIEFDPLGRFLRRNPKHDRRSSQRRRPTPKENSRIQG